MAAWARSRCSSQPDKLAQSRQVIGVDLQGTAARRWAIASSAGRHGQRHGWRAEETRLRQGRRARLFDGGGVAFQFAAQHPEMVRAWRWFPPPIRRTDSTRRLLPQQAALGAAMAEQMKETPMYKSYVAIAPSRVSEAARPEWVLHAQAVRLVGDVKKLTMPVMLIYGDSDMFSASTCEVLPTARRRTEGRRLAARAHVAESLAILRTSALRMGLAPQLVDTLCRSLTAKAAQELKSDSGKLVAVARIASG